jgi:effector-binding domain-containing protein
MSNSAIAAQLLQKLSHLLEANKAYRSIQAEAYVIATKASTGGRVGDSLHPAWVNHFSQGHSEVPDDIFKLVEGFSSLTMYDIFKLVEGFSSAVQDARNLQSEDDPTTRQKLMAGVERADRVAAEIEAWYQEVFKKAKYYSEMWGQMTAQWEHEAKLKKIWNENPGLPLFGASDILAGRKPEWHPIWNRSASSAGSRASSSGGYDEAPWAWQAENDAIEERNYKVWKEGLHDYYHGPNSNRCR